MNLLNKIITKIPAMWCFLEEGTEDSGMLVHPIYLSLLL